MRRTNLRARSWARIGCVMLAAVLAPLLVIQYARSEQLRAAETRIGAVYQKAFYETCELTEGISANYRKLLVAGDDAQLQLLLNDIGRQTQGASGNLALLPLGQQTVAATMKFVNQAEDFAESLSQKVSAGEGVSEADYRTAQTLSDAAAQLSLGMNELLERYERGEAVFDADRFAQTGDAALSPLTNAESAYPVLLYDGPFSDHLGGGSYESVRAQAEVTRETAEARLRAFIQVDGIRYLGQSSPEVECYEFALQSGEYAISAGVTKRGGEILYLLPETEVTEQNYTEAELCDLGRAFLLARGYGDTEMSYYSRYNGILTVNYAVVQDGVVLYPELIKLQLSMKDASVIGMDADGYLKNRAARTLELPAIDRAAAELRIGPRLQARSSRLCVIPSGSAEYLCYEISATDGQGEFLVYVDAKTGVERELMQVVSRDNGTLVM